MADDPNSPGANGEQRIHGLRRWEQWLAGRLSPHGVVRAQVAAPDSGDAVWRIGFREGGWGRIHVAHGAVRLGQEEFDLLTGRLERVDWIRRLREARPGGILIRRNGTIETLDPEDEAGRGEV